MSSFSALQAAAYDAAARQRQRAQFQGMSAYDRHKKMVHDLATYYGRRMAAHGEEGAAGTAAPMKTDYDVLREAYRFIRTEEEDAGNSWEVRLARRYYAKLYREFAIADLSRHKEGRVGLRWRSQKEVVAGKGQFICGAVGCEERRGLASFEVPFAYQEAGQRKQVLVKVRVCPTHAYQLNYRKHKEAEEEHKRRELKEAKRAKRNKRRRRNNDAGSDRSSSETESSDREQEEGRAKHRGKSGIRGEEEEEEGPNGRVDAAAAGGPDAGRQCGGTSMQGRPGGRRAGGDEFEEFFQGLFE